MYCRFTRLAVLATAFAVATVVFPSVFAQDREPERISDTAHCKELKERRHQEARRLHARQHDELARCGPAASARCAEIKERHKREIREWKERSKDELKDCKEERKEDKKDRKEDKKDKDKL
jgi:gas vesicle protein